MVGLGVVEEITVIVFLVVVEVVKVYASSVIAYLYLYLAKLPFLLPFFNVMHIFYIFIIFFSFLFYAPSYSTG